MEGLSGLPGERDHERRVTGVGGPVHQLLGGGWSEDILNLEADPINVGLERHEVEAIKFGGILEKDLVRIRSGHAGVPHERGDLFKGTRYEGLEVGIVHPEHGGIRSYVESGKRILEGVLADELIDWELARASKGDTPTKQLSPKYSLGCLATVRSRFMN